MSKISANFRVKEKTFINFKLMCLYEGCSMTDKITSLMDEAVKSYNKNNKIVLIK